MKFFSFFKKIKFFGDGERLWCAAVFFVTYFVYLLTLYPTVTTEDSGEFSTAVLTLGIAHPPGYPLYVLAGKIFTLLIPFGNPAWKVNLFSAFCGAVAAALFYLCLKFFTRNNVLSFLGAAAFGFGSIFWGQAIRAEVYTFNAVCLLIILLLLLLWHEKEHELSSSESQSLLFFTVFLFGLSLGNHYLMLLAALPFLIFAILSAPNFFKDWKFLLKGVLFFCLGLSVYLFLPIRASMNPPLNWGDPSIWENFWNHVTRKLYSSSAVDASLHFQSAESQNSPGFSPAQWFGDFGRYHVWQMFLFTVQRFAEDYFWGLLVFVPFGFWRLWKKSKHYFWLFASLFICFSFLLSKLLGLGYPDKFPVEFFKDRPFYIPILLLLFFLSVVGMNAVWQKFSGGVARSVFLLILGGTAVFCLFVHFPVQNQSGNYVAHDLASLALEVLPHNAVYIVQNSDNTLFPILYLNKAEGLRQDVRFYIPSPIHVYDFFTDLETVVRENPGRRIFTDFPFADYAGKTYDYFGPVSEILENQNLSFQRQLIPVLQNFVIRGITAVNLDHFHGYLAGRFSLDLGLMEGGIDDAEQQRFFEQALLRSPGSENIFSQLIGNYYVRRNLFDEAIPYLEKAHEFYPNEYSINVELLLSHIFTGDVHGSIPYFSSIVQSNKDLFLREYPQYRSMFPQYASRFDEFEALLKQAVPAGR